MEESVKYFVPEIDDIHVGYECERKVSYGWIPYTIHSSDITDTIDWNVVRVPYLTTEQIEKEGWGIDFARENTLGVYFYKKGKRLDGVEQTFELIVYPDYITIGYDCLQFMNCNIYEGKCPSINEFRYICKLLNINK